MSSIRYNSIFKLETMTTLNNQFLEKIKNQNVMYSIALLFSMLLTLNATAFTNIENVITDDLDITTIEVIEIEEEVVLDFDTKKYLPEGFNALKGKDDLDWSKIELVEIEEDLELNFHSKTLCSL